MQEFSGFNYGAIIGHVSPEAYDWGENIALVENGDEIVIDIPGGEVSLLVSDEELERRSKKLGMSSAEGRKRLLKYLCENVPACRRKGALCSPGIWMQSIDKEKCL